MRNIPQSIQDKINKQNQTIFDNADPKMQVTIARAKNTVMDSTYWTMETIRQKEGLGDISLAPRRFKVTGRPNRIYEIHVDNGMVGTAIREYPDKFKDGWIDQFSLGSGSNVAIAFNGSWHRYRKLWRLITDEKPHIMWVDSYGKLQTQHWDDMATKQELSTDIILVRAIRGWKNVNFVDRDQGIIAGYIKSDGSVWYRNYCDRVGNNPIWESERLLTEFTGTAISLNLALLNDYRIGFIIEDSDNKIHWHITERNWAGMGIGAEHFSVKPKAKINLIPIQYYNLPYSEYFRIATIGTADYLYADAFNNFKIITNIDDGLEDYGNTIEFTTKHRLFGLNTSDFTLKDLENVVFNCVSIQEVETGYEYNWKYKAVFGNFNNAKNDITLTFNGLYAVNESGYGFDSFAKDFKGINLISSEVPAPQIVNITNQLDNGVILEFDYPIDSGVSKSLAAFGVSSKYWKDSFEDVELSETHTISSITQINDTKILLSFNYPSNRIRRANEMTINYDSTIGFISGETYPLASFEETFTPDITKLLDPAIRERFAIVSTANIELKKALYNKRFEIENFKATISALIDFIAVEDLNP